MRIKRERVVFEENQRLENMNKELRLEMDKFITENKELRLKNDIVMEDNARLKNLLISYQTADQVRIFAMFVQRVFSILMTRYLLSLNVCKKAN